jgi:hypothetical protein
VTPAHVSRERRWRMLALVVVVIALVGVVAGTRGTPVPVGALAVPTAQVAAPDAESSSWYCTGQTTAASGGAPGQVVLTNTTSRPVAATIAAVTDTGATEQAAVTVPARDVVVPSVPAPPSGNWESEAVTLSGGGVAVSQTVDGTSGWSQAPCQSTTSATWYFAGGSTSGSNALYLSLLNPTAIPVVVDLSFVTPAGTLHPINYQGLVLNPGQVQVEDVASEVQGASTVSTMVATRTGRVVASEVQVYGGSSAGLAIVPGAARPDAHWVIPQSQEVAGAATEIDVFNPGTTPESVTVQPRLASGPVHPLVQTVAPGATWVLQTSRQTRIPQSATYTTTVDASGGPGVVVARAVAAPSTAGAPQAGLAPAVDGLSASSPTGEWVVPPPGTADHPAVSGAAADYLALANDTDGREQFSAYAVSATGVKLLGTGTLGARDSTIIYGTLAAAGFDQIVVRATGPMGVSEDVGPTGMIGVVTMPGIPLAEAIGL